jgi:hypothetical protein
LRVTERGHKSFILALSDASEKPTQQALGMVGSLTVNAARNKARRWLDLISKEIDPKIEEQRLRAEKKRRQHATFGRVANDFLDRVPSSCRRWSRRRSGPSLPAANQALAHNAVADLCNLLDWETPTDEYEITQSPLRHLEPRGLIATRVVRQRVLTKGKLRAVWSGAGAMLYPLEAFSSC